MFFNVVYLCISSLATVAIEKEDRKVRTKKMKKWQVLFLLSSFFFLSSFLLSAVCGYRKKGGEKRERVKDKNARTRAEDRRNTVVSHARNKREKKKGSPINRSFLRNSVQTMGIVGGRE
jgi:hypothetical protein